MALMKRIGAGAIVVVLFCARGAAADPTKAPVLGWTIDLASGWTIAAHQDSIKDDNGNAAVDLPLSDIMQRSGAVTIELRKTTGQCYDELAMMTVLAQLGKMHLVARDTQAPTDWFPVEAQRDPRDDDRARGVSRVTIYCRDLFDQGYLMLDVESDGAHDAELTTAFAAIDAAIVAQVAPQRPAYQETAAQLLAVAAKGDDDDADADATTEASPADDDDETSTTPAGTSTVVAAADPAPTSDVAAPTPEASAPASEPASEPDATADATADDREPATLDTARWSIAGGQSTLDGGMGTHLYGAARVAITPRPIEDDDSGLVYSAAASAGAAGDAFVGDGFGAGGYRLSGERLVVGGLVAVGVDRVGGGFEPQTGLYVGLDGFARVGFGPVAFEGDLMSTRSSSVDETRAQVGVVTHVGDRVLAIGGFYTRWDAVATIYGASLSLTR
jgi:hypothetical protein